jgi:disulfide bond formation protein DsbB
MSPHVARTLNVWFVLATSCVLLGAFGVQFGASELPCPLCLLQRLAMLGVGGGAMLNVLFGVRPRYYGVSLASALVGGIVAGRQVLLHILPGDAGFGAPLLGLHLYTWSFIAFAAVGGILALMLLFDGQFTVPSRPAARLPLSRFAAVVIGLFLAVAVANVATTLLLCGLGPCEGDPTGYSWLG